MMLALVLGSQIMAPARASAALLCYPTFNAIIARTLDEVDPATTTAIVEDVLAKDSPMVAGGPSARWVNFELNLDDSALPASALRELFSDARIDLQEPTHGAQPRADIGPDSSSRTDPAEITFESVGIDNTWLHINEARSHRSFSALSSRLSFEADERSMRLFGPRYDGAPRLTLPSIYRWQLAPHISLNQDFHFLYDPLGPERDFEDTWATGFRVQIRF